MTKRDTPDLANQAVPLTQEVTQAMSGFLREFKGFQDVVKVKLKQTEERMTMLDRKTNRAVRPHLAAASTEQAPTRKPFAAISAPATIARFAA